MNNLDFIKRMLGSINTSSYYSIKRAFGHTLQTCNIDAVIAYSKMSKEKSETYQNIEFLVAGLCYNTVKQFEEHKIEYVKFEDVLRRLNRDDEVGNFLKLRYDNTGYFAKRFMTLARKAIPLLKSNEQFDYNQLIKDLKHWNNGNSTKMRWAMSIVNLEEN